MNRTGLNDRRRTRRSSLWSRTLAALAVIGQTLAIAAPPAVMAQAADETPILAGGVEVGRHFTQTGGGTGSGYDVREPYYGAMVALGGTTAAGFPVSAPFQGVDGCVYQTFQVVLLQQCAGGAVVRANTFQILEEYGADDRLQQLGIGKGQSDPGATFEEAKRNRLAWLEDAAIRERYLSQCGNGDADAAVEFCGLPMNQPASFGPFVSQRFQRIAFQRWTAPGPGGIAVGQVTASLGGDLLKDTGVLAGGVIQAHALGQAPAIAEVPFTRVGGAAAPAPTGGGTTFRDRATLGIVAARSQPLQYGFQGDFFRTAQRPDTIKKVQGAGFGWVKQQVLWDQYEIDQAACTALRPATTANPNGCLELVPGRFFKADQIGFLDAVMNDLSASGLSVMISIVRAPTFLAATGGHSPNDPERLGQFLTVLINRYKGKIKAVEPWNEQNLSWEWGGERLWPNAPAAPPQGAVDFVNLQKAAYRAIKAADGSVTVVLPALTPTGLAECWESVEARTQGFCLEAMRTAIDDRLYLDFMYQVGGGEIKNFYDVLGVHPSGYNNAPDDWVDVQSPQSEGGFKGHGSFYIKRFMQLRAVQEKYGDSKPMWFTEVGWSVTPSAVPGYEYGTNNTEDERGRYFAGLLAQINREAPYVTNLFIWNLNFRQLVPSNDEKFGFGVLNSDGSPTPAYNCMQDYVKNGNRTTRADCTPYPVPREGIR